jgi:hypothetical protein
MIDTLIGSSNNLGPVGKGSLMFEKEVICPVLSC